VPCPPDPPPGTAGERSASACSRAWLPENATCRGASQPHGTCVARGGRRRRKDEEGKGPCRLRFARFEGCRVRSPATMRCSRSLGLRSPEQEDLHPLARTSASPSWEGLGGAGQLGLRGTSRHSRQGRDQSVCYRLEPLALPVARQGKPAQPALPKSHTAPPPRPPRKVQLEGLATPEAARAPIQSAIRPICCSNMATLKFVGRASGGVRDAGALCRWPFRGARKLVLNASGTRKG
jgi:hypothetical protein